MRASSNDDPEGDQEIGWRVEKRDERGVRKIKSNPAL